MSCFVVTSIFDEDEFDSFSMLTFGSRNIEVERAHDCCVFIHGAGSRLDCGLDKGNILMLPLAA